MHSRRKQVVLREARSVSLPLSVSLPPALARALPSSRSCARAPFLPLLHTLSPRPFSLSFHVSLSLAYLSRFPGCSRPPFLPSSIALFPCPLPLPSSRALFDCPLPLPSSMALFHCPLPLPSSVALCHLLQRALRWMRSRARRSPATLRRSAWCRPSRTWSRTSSPAAWARSPSRPSRPSPPK